MTTLISDDYSVVALYGIPESESVASEFYKTALNWCESLEHPSDKLAVHGNGFSGKVGSFRQINSKLQKNGFGLVEGFSLYSTLPDTVIPMNDNFLSVSYDHSPKSSLLVLAARSSVASWSTSAMLDITQQVAQIVKPAYGIGYVRNAEQGPGLYAYGICQGLGIGLQGEAYEEALRISRWSNIGMVRQVYRQGLLRDVYPWNFLASAQLSSQVNGVSLQEWIRQDQERGELSAITSNLLLWQVKEENIAEIRAELWQAEVIFNWRKYL